MADNTELEASIARLSAFRQSWNEGDVICDDCGLTADDLDRILARLAETGDMVAIRYVDLSKGFPPDMR